MINTPGRIAIKPARADLNMISETSEIKFNCKGKAILSRFASIDKHNNDDFLKAVK